MRHNYGANNMGLDISAYSKLAPTAGMGTVQITQAALDETEKNFPGRSEGLKAGNYTASAVLHFRAGSYTSYGEWRDWLTKLCSPNWDRNNRPFWELICFFDNEGFIGPVTAKKLATDFFAYSELAKKLGDEIDCDLYARFWSACMLAANDGAIEFH
jgi:hypothetical protein